MREIDTETPVVWPAWCYSGEATTDDATPQQASSPHQTQTISNNSNNIINNNSNRGKRKNSPSLIGSTLRSSPSTISSSSLSTLSALNQSTLSSIDKMLNDRMMASSNSNNNNNNSIDNNNKKFCDNGNNVLNNNNIINNSNSNNNNNNLFYETIKQEDSLDLNLKLNGDLTHNSNSNNNNNSNSKNNNSNSIKNERLSPSNNNSNINNFNTNGEQSSASRSRSATPSSYPGTPPQGLNSIDLHSSLGVQQTLSQRPEIQGRNYSDFMRSLAAKYNNQNESSNSTKNLFFDPRLNNTPLKSTTKESFPVTPDVKKQQQQSTNAATAAAVATAAQHLTNMSSLFSGLPFPPGVFPPPIIDMSSTQALITLARAAKEAEIQNILKNANASTNKRNSNSVNSNSSNLRNLSPNIQQNHLGTPKIPNFQLNPGFSLANFHQQMSQISNSTATSPSNNNNNTSNNHNSNNNTLNSSNNSGDNLTTTPLDLSSSTPIPKKIRIDENSIQTLNSRLTISPVLSTKSNSSETKPFSGGSSTSSQNQQHVQPPQPSPTARRCHAQSEEINSWSVEQVCEFVGSIDICAEYVQNFRDQQIDGTGLPLLTEDHLTNSLGLKLGPALKLKSILAKKFGGPCPCVSCSTGLSSNSSYHSGGAIKKEYNNSVVNNIPWPSSAESES